MSKRWSSSKKPCSLLSNAPQQCFLGLAVRPWSHRLLQGALSGAGKASLLFLQLPLLNFPLCVHIHHMLVSVSPF